MANLNLVTGFAGTPHVTANDAGTLNASIFGAGQYVMNYGNKLKASVISNNIVRVLDGVVMMQGRQIRIEDAASVDIAIENGASGYFRNDLIVARYTKDANTGVEEANLVVIKGTATTGTAADPAFTSGNIFGGAIQNDMPLYRIPIDGINVQEPVALFEITGSFGEHALDKNNPHKVTPKQIGAMPDSYVAPVQSVNGLTGKVELQTSNPLDSYPVGALFWSSNPVSPASLFGGTWTQIEDKFILAAGVNYNNGETGGSKTHTHKYGWYYGSYNRNYMLTGDVGFGPYDYSSETDYSIVTGGSSAGTGSLKVNNGIQGGSKSVTGEKNNISARVSYADTLPPYAVKYCWERTA